MTIMLPRKVAYLPCLQKCEDLTSFVSICPRVLKKYRYFDWACQKDKKGQMSYADDMHHTHYT